MEKGRKKEQKEEEEETKTRTWRRQREGKEKIQADLLDEGHDPFQRTAKKKHGDNSLAFGKWTHLE